MCFSHWLCQTGSKKPQSSLSRVLPSQNRPWQTTWGLNSGPETSVPPSKHEIPGDGLLASLESHAIKPTLPQNISPSVWMWTKTVAGPVVAVVFKSRPAGSAEAEAHACSALIVLSQNGREANVWIVFLWVCCKVSRPCLAC